MNKCNECGSDNADKLKYCCNCGYELTKQKPEEIEQPVEKPINRKDYKKIAGIIVGIIAFFAASFLVQQLFFKAPKLDKIMTEVMSEINKSCPIMIDSETRLDNTVVIPPNIFQYNYTLINMEEGTVDIAMLKNHLEPNITNFVRTNPDMKFQRDNKMTVNYYYGDKNRNHLFTISVIPEQYE